MACFIMTGEIIGGGKYGGISPKPPIFPVIILPVTSASQNFSLIQENLLVSFCPRRICQHYDQ